MDTPALLLDVARLDANLAAMRARADRWPGVTLRPHLKTAKCIEVADRAVGRGGPITVSTLYEAERFCAAGFADILYAVGIAPAKLPRAAALAAAGCRLGLILDSRAAADALVERWGDGPLPARVSIEIDSDGHRGGLKPDDPAIVAIGRRLHHAGLPVGVMTHAGGSYAARDVAEIRAFAAAERRAVVDAAAMLRGAGVPVDCVSVGSTPTATFGDSFAGVSEMRPGVYMFGDLVMAGLGVTTPDAIAIAVVCSVIAHRAAAGRLIVDAGWMAMSRDRGTAAQPVDQGYGLVRGVDGESVGDLVMVAANQEHGIVGRRDGAPVDPAAFPIGTRLRILPNHACATAAQHAGYHLVGGGWWPRFNGW